MNFEKLLRPELREALENFNFEIDITRESVVLFRETTNEFALNSPPPENDYVSIHNRIITGPSGADLTVRIYEPKQKSKTLPGVLSIHGGGYTIGIPEMDDYLNVRIAQEVNCVVVSPYYRLAPENPYPAPLEDCYTTLQWLVKNAAELKVDPANIAVLGRSAGGGLTAALCLLARDQKGPAIKFQMPIYPMIDDRCNSQSNREIDDKRVWNGKNNMAGWEMYLGENKGEVSQYAASARAIDLSGLPPAYICVGDLEPFRDETIEYVSKLTKAGVPVEFHLYPGCFHGFDIMFPELEIAKKTTAEYIQALKAGLESKP